MKVLEQKESQEALEVQLQTWMVAISGDNKNFVVFDKNFFAKSDLSNYGQFLVRLLRQLDVNNMLVVTDESTIDENVLDEVKKSVEFPLDVKHNNNLEQTAVISLGRLGFGMSDSFNKVGTRDIGVSFLSEDEVIHLFTQMI
jgi:hypothetical protein